MNKWILLLVLSLIVSACFSEPKIDASSDEKMQKSIAAVMKDLNETQQKDFEDALQIIMLSNVDSLKDLAMIGQNEAVSKGIFQAKIDGKTATEIIQMAQKINIQYENMKEPSERAGVPVSAKDFLTG